MSKSQIERAGGNPELMILGVFYAFIGAGLYEEFMFRGFLMHGLAMFFGAGRGAWIVACVLQGALFAAADAYQNQCHNPLANSERPKNQKQTAPRVFTARGAICFKANKLRTMLAGS